MGAKRLIRFESEVLKQTAKAGQDIDNVLDIINDLAKWVGKEVDYIENLLGVTGAPATSGSLFITEGGATGKGIIATGTRALAAGANMILFDEPLKSNTYEVIPIVYDNGTLIEMNPDKATGKTINSFNYDSPGIATMFFFAMVHS
jgi:hypothetical protein